MSKGLEALERIVELAKYDIDLSYDFNDLQNDKDTIEKELKALEIIKKKRVNVRCLMSGWSLEKYNSYKTHINLTQEEYVLLKEVLP